MTPGRPPLGSRIVQHLDGDAATKQRLQILLQTLAGELSVTAACEKLHISQARFFELRAAMLQSALDALAPKPPGRPIQKTDPAQQRLQQLEQQNLDLRVHLAAAQLREEIALAMPHLSARHRSARKKTPRHINILPPSHSSPSPHPRSIGSDSSTPESSDT